MVSAGSASQAGSTLPRRKTSSRGKVLVAMSGGVDSSAAAGLLHEQGYDLVGVTMHLWDAEGADKVGRCCAPEDREDARRTCEYLGIPHFVLDYRASFRKHVVDPFLDEYRAGRTPIPCVHCNRTVKLTQLVELADQLGATHIATGHYARHEVDGYGSRLLRGQDRTKDQSYFLFGLPNATLGRLMFPLGGLLKTEVREHARRLGLPGADKPESQELCFVPDGDTRAFAQRQRGEGQPGVIREASGKVLGRHAGIEGFTVGQRRGLGIGGGKTRYVLSIVAETSEVVVGDATELLQEELTTDSAHWIRPWATVQSADNLEDGRARDFPAAEGFAAEVQIRYRHRAAEAWVTPHEGGFRARFAVPQRAVTPGQAAVVYRGEEVVGGGFIC